MVTSKTFSESAVQTRNPFLLSALACTAVGIGVLAARESKSDDGSETSLFETPVLHALGTTVHDADGDGLCDRLEVALFTSPDLADTDGDGYSDAEELARHSSPLQSRSIPGAEDVNIGMGVYEADGLLHPVCAIYSRDGRLRDKQFGLGMLLDTTVVHLPLSTLGRSASSKVAATHDSGQMLLIFDPMIDSTLLHSSGSLSLFSTLTVGGVVRAADALNLSSMAGVISRFVLVSERGGPAPFYGQGIGSVYRPIGGATIPNTWSPGEICSQSMVVVGVQGAVVTQEVVAAGCESGWDSYCDGGCGGSVGRTVRIIDPSVLVGG